MVKEWKSYLKYSGSSIKNKEYPRIKYDVKNLDSKYKMKFSDFEDEKYISSYYRKEIDKKDLPKDIDNSKINKFLSRMELVEDVSEELIETIKEIDKKNAYNIIKDKELSFQVPKIITIPDYERYKAFHALLTNKITENQFRKLYPWPYTLNVLNSLLYDFFDRKEQPSTNKFFWNIYPDDTDLFLGELWISLSNFEDKINRKDVVDNLLKPLVNEFFVQIEERKIKIIPTSKCPEISQCMRLSGDIDTTDKSCMVYYYPQGYKKGKVV
jgi:hypothetical protein